MLKWFNGEMIPDGEAMIVRQFCRGGFFVINLRVGVDFCRWSNFFLLGRCPGGHFPGKSPSTIFR